MIAGVAQVVLNVADADAEAARWEAAGFSRTFAETALKNHDAKAPLQARPRTALDMIHLAPSEATPAVEITAYAGDAPAGRAAYRVDDLLPPRAATAVVSDAAASRAFWTEGLGFAEGEAGTLSSPGLLPSMRLRLTLDEAPDAAPATVDADGCVLVTLLSTDAVADTARLVDGGLVAAATDVWSETIDGRELVVSMVTGPGGEPVEILQAPKARRAT